MGNRFHATLRIISPLHLIQKDFSIDSLLISHAESSSLNTDMCNFESPQKDESRAQSPDFPKAYRKSTALRLSV